MIVRIWLDNDHMHTHEENQEFGPFVRHLQVMAQRDEFMEVKEPSESELFYINPKHIREIKLIQK